MLNKTVANLPKRRLIHLVIGRPAPITTLGSLPLQCAALLPAPQQTHSEPIARGFPEALSPNRRIVNAPPLLPEFDTALFAEHCRYGTTDLHYRFIASRAARRNLERCSYC
jgi:hypothetical protein